MQPELRERRAPSVLVPLSTPCIAVLVVTLAYQVFIPVSVACALAVPLYYAWALWDRWWLSPIFLGTLLMAPLKFVPWAPICLLWPGLI